VGAPTAMSAWRIRTGNARALFLAVFYALVPGIGGAETTSVDTAVNQAHAVPQHRASLRTAPQRTVLPQTVLRQMVRSHAPRAAPHTKPLPEREGRALRNAGRFGARPAALAGVAKPPPSVGADLGHGFTTASSGRSATSGAGHAVSTTAVPMQNPRAAAAVHFTPDFLRAAHVGAVSGNIEGRRARGVTMIGGPARYDAKHGAVIGGPVMRWKQ
jgi:hypothetical protein